MKKPLFTRITHLSSRTHLGRLLHWNLSKDLQSEIGPLSKRLDSLETRVGMLAGFTQRRTLSISDELRQVDKIIHQELAKIMLGYAIALLIVSLGCLIGFLVN